MEIIFSNKNFDHPTAELVLRATKFGRFYVGVKYVELVINKDGSKSVLLPFERLNAHSIHGTDMYFDVHQRYRVSMDTHIAWLGMWLYILDGDFGQDQTRGLYVKALAEMDYSPTA